MVTKRTDTTAEAVEEQAGAGSPGENRREVCFARTCGAEARGGLRGDQRRGRE